MVRRLTIYTSQNQTKRRKDVLRTTPNLATSSPTVAIHALDLNCRKVWTHYRILRKSQGVDSLNLEVEIERREFQLTQLIENQGLRKIYRSRLIGLPIIFLLSSLLVTLSGSFLVFAHLSFITLLASGVLSFGIAAAVWLNFFISRPRGPFLGEISNFQWSRNHIEHLRFLFGFYTDVIERMVDFEKHDGDLKSELYFDYAMQKNILEQVIRAAVLSLQHMNAFEHNRRTPNQQRILLRWEQDLRSLLACAREEFWQP